MKSKRILIIALCTVISLVGLLYYANAVKISAKEMFELDGYVLTNNLENEGKEKEPSQFYFKANSAYEKKWPSKVMFHDTESSKVILENQTFLHYTNGDMGAFTDGVLVDLNGLEQTPINYYRIKAGAILKKVGENFQMNHLGQKITMTNLLWKLSESKYIVVSPEIKINLGENNVKDVKGFLEVEIKDKGIITLRNQNVAYQTVVADSKLELRNGVVLDFNKKEITKEDKAVFSLTQMVVDAEANIEIVPEENKSIPEKDGTPGSDNDPDNPNANPNADPNNPTKPGENGTENPDSKEEEQPDITFEDTAVPNISIDKPDVDEETESNTPSSQKVPGVTLNSLKPSIVGVEVMATINDEEDILTEAGIDVKIFEKSSNKLVFSTNIAKGIQKIEQDIQNLNTNTDYVLVISGAYVLNKVEYTNDFLNKQFRTDMLDLNYKINEKTASTLSYKVFAEKETRITSAMITLYTADKVESQKLQLTKEDIKVASTDGFLAEFTFLQANTIYFTKITDVVYNDSMAITEYDTFKEIKTLKTVPTLTQPTAFIDKRNSSFSLFPGDVTDPNNGILKYRYEIIDSVDTSNIVYNSERDIKGSIEVSVDGREIRRKHNYFWRLVAIFNDNDKVVEVASPESEIFSLDTNNLPQLNFTETTIHHDAITGTIDIVDRDNVILRGNYTDHAGTARTSSIKVYATDPVSQPIDIGAAASTNVPADWNGTMAIPINLTSGLRANETETFKVYADVNLGENPATGSTAAEFNRNQYYLGELRVKTTSAIPFRVNAAKDTSTDATTLSRPYILTTQLLPVEADDTTTAEYIASTLQTVNYSIYRGVVPANDEAITNAAAQLIASGNVSATADTAQNHNSSIKTELFDKAGQISSADVSFDWTRLGDTDVTIVFKDAKDYVGNTINLGDIENRVFSFGVNGATPALPKSDTDAVDYQLIQNRQLAPGTDWESLGTSPKPNLNNNTIVGISFAPRLNNSAATIGRIVYKITEEGNPGRVIVTRTQTLRPHVANIPRIILPIQNGVDGAGNDVLRRGHRYTITYEVDLDLNYDGTVETQFLNSTGRRDFSSTRVDVQRQPAIFKTRLNYTAAATGGTATLSYLLRDVDASYMRKQTGVNTGKIMVNFTRTPDATTTAASTEQREVSRSANANDWKTLTLNNVQPGTIEAKTDVYIYNTPGLVAGSDGEQTISSQRIYPNLANIETFFKADTEITNNNLVVTLKKADAKTDTEFKNALKHVVGAQITVSDTADANNTVTTEIAQLRSVGGGSANAYMRIPLTSISKLIGKTISVSTKLHYLNGNATTDLTKLKAANTTLYAVEVVNPRSSTPSYLYDNQGTSLVRQTDVNYPANASVFKAVANGASLNFENKINKNKTIYNAENTGFPLKISIGTNIVENVKLKEVGTADVTTDSSTVANGFKTISGGITVANAAGELEIVKGIDRAELSYTVDMRNATPAKGNKVYFELYEKAAAGTTPDFPTNATKTYEATIATGRQKIMLGGLKVGQTYKIKEYIKVDTAQADGTTSETKVYLYDINKNSIGAEYTFVTSNRVALSNMKAALDISDTGANAKSMKLTYNIDQIGFTKVTYEIKAYNDTTSAYDQVIAKITNTNESTFARNMSMTVPIGTGSGQLQLGKKYQVLVQVFSTKNPYGDTSEKQISTDDSSKLAFQLAPLRNPIANIQLVPGVDGTKQVINATINIKDSDYASTTKKYKVKLLNDRGVDITPDAIKSREYNFSAQNNKIKFENGGTTIIEPNKNYTLEVTTKVDLYANGTTSDHTMRAGVTTLNSFGVALGDMEIVDHEEAGKADLQFYGAVNLNRVKKISYTLYNASTGTSASITDETFNISSQGSGAGQYWRHTISGFTTSGRYSVQVLFLSENNEMIGTLNKSFIYK